jgi:uncharacterized protein YacL (UPF0231 family)
MKIGDVELPIVSEITPFIEAEVDEIKPLKSHSDSIDSVPVKHENSVEEITIGGFVNSEVHSQHLSLDEQKEDLKKLRRNSKFDNSFTYSDYNGYLLVEEVDFDDNSDSRIVHEVEIECRYFPWPKYYSGDRP